VAVGEAAGCFQVIGPSWCIRGTHCSSYSIHLLVMARQDRHGTRTSLNSVRQTEATVKSGLPAIRWFVPFFRLILERANNLARLEASPPCRLGTSPLHLEDNCGIFRGSIQQPHGPAFPTIATGKCSSLCRDPNLGDTVRVFSQTDPLFDLTASGSKSSPLSQPQVQVDRRNGHRLFQLC
jgi:hypothetical protein